MCDGRSGVGHFIEDHFHSIHPRALRLPDAAQGKDEKMLEKKFDPEVPFAYDPPQQKVEEKIASWDNIEERLRELVKLAREGK